MDDAAGHLKFKNSAWDYFVGVSVSNHYRNEDSIFEVLHHPNYVPDRRSPMVMQDHIGDVGTGKYSDVDQVLSAIFFALCVTWNIVLVFVVGDQQVCVKSFIKIFYQRWYARPRTPLFHVFLRPPLAYLCLQSFNRMVHLKRKQPSEFRWMVPCPGNFHFKVREWPVKL